MITLEMDSLGFRFPEVDEAANLTVSFIRTLRVPDDNREYPLPAGFGRFPIRHVDDYADHLPSRWLAHGGVLVPLHQAEALWISFETNYPMALKVSAGKINAVTGNPFTPSLQANPQDYLVVPEQPWLDGFNIRKGAVRQFVAMPLGQGYSAEEQLTGRSEIGGIQLVCYPMLKTLYADLQERHRRWRKLDARMSYSRVACEMAIAPGGVIRQQIHDDPHGIDAWDISHVVRCFVHLLNSAKWNNVTGEPPPPTPISRKEYERCRVPWFDFYFDDERALPGSTRLAGLDSVAAKEIKQGSSAASSGNVLGEPQVVDLSKRARVREGSF